MLKQIKCRDHGGFFKVEARRGRPPVKCTPDNKCDAQTVAAPTKARTAHPRSDASKTGLAATQSKMPTSGATLARSNASAPADRAGWVEGRQETIAQVKRIFRELSALGWNATRGWVDNTVAEITATRGEEMIYVTVRNGKVSTQYSLWNFDKPSVNNKPESNLPFDPDEIGDGELARYLVGTKVTWYNRLSDKTETAYCGKDSIRIEHGYNAVGDEVPGERIIKFVDADGTGFRAFRLDQLIKVGK